MKKFKIEFDDSTQDLAKMVFEDFGSLICEVAEERNIEDFVIKILENNPQNNKILGGKLMISKFPDECELIVLVGKNQPVKTSIDAISVELNSIRNL